jgi:Mg/Co/Ni transporter MgtE
MGNNRANDLSGGAFVNISESMKHQVISINVSADIAQAVSLLNTWHISTLPVVDDENRLVGMLQIHDLLNLAVPGFERLLEDFDFVHDLGALENYHPTPEELARKVATLMQPPVSVEVNSGLLRAATLLRCHNLTNLPVVDANDHLVGIVSFVDIGTVLLSQWLEDAARGSQV